MYSSIGLKTVVLHGWVVWFRLDLELFAHKASPWPPASSWCLQEHPLFS
jgi:hypothetical protein